MTILRVGAGGGRECDYNAAEKWSVEERQFVNIFTSELSFFHHMITTASQHHQNILLRRMTWSIPFLQTYVGAEQPTRPSRDPTHKIWRRKRKKISQKSKAWEEHLSLGEIARNLDWKTSILENGRHKHHVNSWLLNMYNKKIVNMNMLCTI